MVQPGVSRPSASACSTMCRAGRSLTEPVGLRSSSLAQTLHVVGRRQPRQADQRGVADRRQRAVVAHQRRIRPAAGDGRAGS